MNDFRPITPVPPREADAELHLVSTWTGGHVDMPTKDLVALHDRSAEGHSPLPAHLMASLCELVRQRIQFCGCEPDNDPGAAVSDTQVIKPGVRTRLEGTDVEILIDVEPPERLQLDIGKPRLEPIRNVRVRVFRLPLTDGTR